MKRCPDKTDHCWTRVLVDIWIAIRPNTNCIHGTDQCSCSHQQDEERLQSLGAIYLKIIHLQSGWVFSTNTEQEQECQVLRCQMGVV